MAHSVVIAGLDPAIQLLRKEMDARVKPGHDEKEPNLLVMPALVAGIHVLGMFRSKDVDARDEPGHDEEKSAA